MHLQAHSIEQIIGGIAALLATLHSVGHIWRHHLHNATALRMCTIRILAVVPIFAIAAWASLMVETSRVRWASPLSYVRELYESVAMLSFMQFILTCLGGPLELAHELERGGAAEVSHPGPLKHVLRAYSRGGPEFVARVSVGILQYAVISLCLFVINCLVWRPPWDPREPWFHKSQTYVETATKVAKSASCGWAMYNLGLFYHQVHSRLASIRPVLKFMSIKGVIFFTFWQGIVIFAIDKTGAIPKNPEDASGGVWSEEEISAGIQHFLLCIEMLFFAEVHRRAYPVQDAPATAGGGDCGLPELWRELGILWHSARRRSRSGSTDLNTVVGLSEEPLTPHDHSPEEGIEL